MTTMNNLYLTPAEIFDRLTQICDDLPMGWAYNISWNCSGTEAPAFIVNIEGFELDGKTRLQTFGSYLDLSEDKYVLSFLNAVAAHCKAVNKALAETRINEVEITGEFEEEMPF